MITFNKINLVTKKITLIFISVLLIIVISYFFQKNQKNEIVLKSFEAYKSQCNFSGMSEEGQLYTNKMYNFTFTYPKDHIVCEITSSDSKGEYGEQVNIHVMSKTLFESTDSKYITTHNIQDSLLLDIFKSNESQIPRASLKEILPSRTIDGIEAIVGIAEILGCKKSSCPRVVVTRFTRGDISYEFGAVRSFDEVFNTFKFPPKK